MVALEFLQVVELEGMSLDEIGVAVEVDLVPFVVVRRGDGDDLRRFGVVVVGLAACARVRVGRGGSVWVVGLVWVEVQGIGGWLAAAAAGVGAFKAEVV